MSRRKAGESSKLPLSFKAFLSHRYKSPDINLYFFRIFAEIAEVQFEVDEGVTATNVTRLERMIRAADAFIGIYPFPGNWGDAQSATKLREASKYFRLELDLAIRSRKPAVIFYDKRYGDMVKPPGDILARTFEAQEVEGKGGYPSADLHRKIFSEFCEIVAAKKRYDVARTVVERDCTGIIVPSGPGGYAPHHISAIVETLRECVCDNIRVLKWPPVLAREMFSLLQELEMVCVDIGGEIAKTGIPAYLHGQFIPTIRMKKANARDVQSSPLERTLYGGVEVGYHKDILAWREVRTLRKGLKNRVLRIKQGVRRINTADEAEAYFREAALRKEPIFLSYSGKDEHLASQISRALKEKYQEVFDYRDGKSIRPGQPWIAEIFERLSTSAVGIPLLSDNYFKSKNCEHEAEDMVAQRDNEKMHLLPVRLYDEKLDIPPWLKNIQHFRMSDYNNDPTMAVQEIVRNVDEVVARKKSFKSGDKKLVRR